MVSRCSTARLTAEGTIAFIWRSACRKHWSPKRVRRELLIARNDFVKAEPFDDDEDASRALGVWYRAAKEILPGRIRNLEDLRQVSFSFERRSR